MIYISISLAGILLVEANFSEFELQLSRTMTDLDTSYPVKQNFSYDHFKINRKLEYGTSKNLEAPDSAVAPITSAEYLLCFSRRSIRQCRSPW